MHLEACFQRVPLDMKAENRALAKQGRQPGNIVDVLTALAKFPSP
jgi:hypothetical protein